MKIVKVVWHPKAKEDLSGFPAEVKFKLGHLIYRLQLEENLSMPQSRSMTSVARGAKELRVKGKDGAYRSFYIRLENGVLTVFHAFQKKSQKTNKKDIETGKNNLKEIKKWLKEK